MQLVFASGNKNKIQELGQLIGKDIDLLGLEDIGCRTEIPETSPTIEGNALQKAWYIVNHYQRNCFADDTGLEIDALEGRPGVLSARYAGESKDAGNNMDKVLGELAGQNNRRARFRTVIALILDGKALTFEGVMEGEILQNKRGIHGFGYDPIFQPSGFNRSFAEMTLVEKNKLSHRAIAVHKLVDYLKGLISQ
jgi:XTP/dITP diphosphohydrolase